jgi:hypothetical protein
MSKLKVNSIVNKTEDGPVELTNGLIIASGVFNIDSSVSVAGVLTAANYSTSSVNVSGVVTATSFVGDGSQLTNIQYLASQDESKIIAYKRILGFDEYRSS